MQQIKIKKRARIFQYLREKIGLNAHTLEFYRFQSEFLESITKCEDCKQVVKIGQPFEYVGRERVSHQKCLKNIYDQ